MHQQAAGAFLLDERRAKIVQYWLIFCSETQKSNQLFSWEPKTSKSREIISTFLAFCHSNSIVPGRLSIAFFLYYSSLLNISALFAILFILFIYSLFLKRSRQWIKMIKVRLENRYQSNSNILCLYENINW